jgi:hypothetical protein
MNYNINRSLGIQDISFDLDRVGGENFPSLNSFIEFFLNNANIDYNLDYCLFIKLKDKMGTQIMLEESYLFSLSKMDMDDFEGLYYDVKKLTIVCQNKEFSEDFKGDFCIIQLCFGEFCFGAEPENINDFVKKVLDY